MSSFRLLIGSVVLGAGLGFTPEASAHIRLSEPLARYEITGQDTGIKGCPCGMATGGGNSNRTCNVELDGSDPARNEERASTFPAGSTIKLKFEEYVGHAGRYRVAFDPEGADFDDFNANVIHDETDPAGSEGNINDGTKWEIEVTLPDTPCDNCTLQLLQVMAGGTENPVDGNNLATLSTYYTCIDLTLTAPEGNTTDEGSAGDSSEASVSSDEETSESSSMGEETSSSEEVGSSSAASTGASSSGATDDESSDEATSTSPTVPTSAGVAPPNPSSTATTAPTSTAATTTTASATSSVNSATTESPIPDEDSGDDTEEGGCSIAVTRAPSTALLAVIGTVLGAILRRRRRA